MPAWTTWPKHGDYFCSMATPLTRIHLYSNIKGEFEANGNIRYVYIFMIIAIFILLLACVNFMNLSHGPPRRAVPKRSGFVNYWSLTATSVYHSWWNPSLASFIASLSPSSWYGWCFFNHAAGKAITLWPKCWKTTASPSLLLWRGGRQDSHRQLPRLLSLRFPAHTGIEGQTPSTGFAAVG